jgi:hypothetical protein
MDRRLMITPGHGPIRTTLNNRQVSTGQKADAEPTTYPFLSQLRPGQVKITPIGRDVCKLQRRRQERFRAARTAAESLPN